MGRRSVMLLLAMMGLILFSGSEAADEDVNAKAKKLSLDIQNKLKLLNRRGAKSIKSEDGDIVDCVDIYKQPAFDHPALRNHKIQMRPTFQFASQAPSTSHSPTPIPGPSRSPVQHDNNSSQLISQIWQRSGSCPDGTIPIRRIQKRDLLKATSLERFGMKTPAAPNSDSTNDDLGTVYINKTRVELGPQINRSASDH